MESRGRRRSEARTPHNGGPVPGLHVRYPCSGLAAAAAFAAAVARAVGDAARSLDASVGPDGVEFRLATSATALAVPAAHVELARVIGAVAAEHGLVPDPGEDEHDLPTPSDDGARSRFWAALLGAGTATSTPEAAGRAPDLWVLPAEPCGATGARWHLDLWLDPQVAPVRIAAALAAGGRVVDDVAAPSYTVLADPQGQLACVCTVDDAPR